MRFSRVEQETTIVWDEELKVANIYTASPVTMRKLDKLAAEHPDVYLIDRAAEDGSAKKYHVPAKYIRFGKPASEAKRRAARHLHASS